MTVDVQVYVENIADTIASYDTIRLYRGTDPSVSPFTGLPVADTALVAATLDYTIEDTTGTSDYWYRYSFYNSTTTAESDQSAPIAPGGLTLKQFRSDAARAIGLRFSSVASSAVGGAGGVCDTKLLDSGVDTGFHSGDWLLFPARTGDDQVRRVAKAGFDTATGVLSFTRALSSTTTEAEVYQLFQLFPPIDWPGAGISWTQCINNALSTLVYRDRVDVGIGTTAGKTRYALSQHLGQITRDAIARVEIERLDTDGNVIGLLDVGTQSTWFDLLDDDGLTLILGGYTPGTTEHVMVTCNRGYDPLYAEDDVLTGPAYLARLAVAREVFFRANLAYKGLFKEESAAADAEFVRIYRTRYRPQHTIRGL